MPGQRTFLLTGALVGAVAVAMSIRPRQPVSPRAEVTTVLLIVLDTVRADHISGCGYDRPTTPHLDRLARRPDVSLHCRAYAPSTWTLPSHASFFTGAAVHEHGADTASDGPGAFDWGQRHAPLDGSLPTLAERFRARGFQAVALSANPVVGPESGLLRGFEAARTAEGFGVWSDRWLRMQLGELLRHDLDANRSLFLFVNIVDAHSPYASIPEEHPWLPLRRGYRPGIHHDGAHHRAMRGELTREQEAAFRSRLTDLYDRDLTVADATVEHVLARLQEVGWLRPGSRVVITADHGENLGEHGVYDHASPWTFEPEVRVPLWIWTVDAPDAQPPLDPAHPVGGPSFIHDLVLDGVVGDGPVLVETTAKPHFHRHYGERFGLEPGVAWVGDGHKVIARSGALERYDLESDPGEMRPLPAGADEAVRRVQDRVEALKKMAPRETDSDLDDALRALGYTR